MSITGRQSHVLRRAGSLQRVKAGAHAEDEAEGCEEVYAEHGEYSSTPDTSQSPLLSQKFETEPTKYFEDKILSALFDKMLIRHVTLATAQFFLCKIVKIKYPIIHEVLLQVLTCDLSVSGALEPALSCYEAKVRSGARLGGGWEEAMVTAIRRRDSLEEDSIFSLGKILASPRYGQYPDLSDEEEEDQVFADHHLSLPYDPLSLPTIRQVKPAQVIRFSVK